MPNVVKSKCIVCKAQNTGREMSRHLTTVSVLNHKRFLEKIKNKEDLHTICDTHRNPLIFNTEVIALFSNWNKFHAIATKVL